MFFLAVIIAGSIIFWTLRLGIGPVPTSSAVCESVQELLPDQVSGCVFELGAGWGQLLILLKEKYILQETNSTEKKIVAYERSPIPALFSQIKTGIKVIQKDFFFADFQNAGLIICYLYSGAMERIEMEVIPQLPTGCWIITHTFSLRRYKAVKIIKARDIYHTPVYLYRV